MYKTPGLIIPSAYSSKEELEQDLNRRAESAGFSVFESSDFDPESIKHFGVKGMRWGVRNSELAGVSRSTNRQAKRDAEEFARAKVFYGESAGTRRKLIKATVEGKSKKDPSYAKAFDHHLNKQDMSRHVSKARGERKRKDVRNSTAKTARGINHMLRGNTRYASAAAAGLFTAGVAIHKTGIDKAIARSAKTAYKTVRSNVRGGSTNIRAGMPASEFLKNMGL